MWHYIMLTLTEIATSVAKTSLARTRVFSERRFVTFRNECLNDYMIERRDLSMRAMMDDIIADFGAYETEIRAVYDDVCLRRTQLLATAMEAGIPAHHITFKK